MTITRLHTGGTVTESVCGGTGLRSFVHVGRGEVTMLYRKYPSSEASFQKIGTEMAPHQTGSLPTSLERQYRRALTAARSSYFSNLIEEQ